MWPTVASLFQHSNANANGPHHEQRRADFGEGPLGCQTLFTPRYEEPALLQREAQFERAAGRPVIELWCETMTVIDGSSERSQPTHNHNHLPA